MDRRTPLPADASRRRDNSLPGEQDASPRRETRGDGAHNVQKTLLAMVERERALFGYDIHDGIVQYLVGAMMAQEKALELLQACSVDAAHKEFTRALALVTTAIGEARRMINHLRPGALEQLGLVGAIRQLVADSQRLYGVDCIFEKDEQCIRLDAPIETAIFRIVQEALSNALRHSRSQAVLVTLKHKPHELLLKVEDWGVGFDQEAVTTQGVGLAGMRYRVALLEGRMKIRSIAGKGTLITVKLPHQ
jgi:signal transduction histidine kinase